ncbi:SDR family oxidoreductase [Parvibaculum sp.]|jgi:NAD(P)-dependent dehydrogenase (short-subunit alcohol dehydrogenase family)|uniref:SDR family oxidoreductase n=1 Tax=Parvibaculum sp. TaxID=2024848 RepID=UPI002A31082B|nr:SDR family oxidoreductase [Parvibaculum sp.]
MGQANGRKSIFITGAASGMGLETARLFAGKGWFVGGYDVNGVGLVALEKELGPDNCIVRKLDVTDKEAYDAAVADFGEATGGKMDILFNNAGIGAGGLFADMNFEDNLRVVQVNFIGVLNGIHAALPLLKATANSLCFTTSSSSATYGMPGIAVYSATKHAVKGLTEALSIEFRLIGVRAADVLPGLIDTPILPAGAVANAPKEGMFRAIPPVEVAKVVWEAYGSDKLHWYVPPELVELDKAAGNAPEMVREQIATTGPIAPMLKMMEEQAKKG